MKNDNDRLNELIAFDKILTQMIREMKKVQKDLENMSKRSSELMKRLDKLGNKEKS